MATALFAGSIVLVGCSSSSTATTTTSTSPGTSTKVLAPGQTIPFDPAQNARADVTVTACTRSSGAWVVKGSVTNRAGVAKSFQIVIDFVTKPGSTVISSSEANIADVGSHATVHWSATGAKGESGGVACFLRQAQTT